MSVDVQSNHTAVLAISDSRPVDAPSRPMTRALLCGVGWVKAGRKPRRRVNAGRTLRIADVYCGCGGLTLGAQEAARRNGFGFEIGLALDADEGALGIYKNNFRLKKDAAICRDVSQLIGGQIGTRTTKGERLVEKNAGTIDVMLAGPPCQGHSDLNNSSRRKDERNKLYLKTARLVEITAPAIVVIENVPAVVHDSDHVVVTTKKSLESMGYCVTDGVVHMQNLGIPQRRKRHLLVAAKEQVDIPGYMVDPPTSITPLSEFLADIQSEPQTSNDIFRTPSRMSAANLERVRYLFENGVYDLPNKLRPDCHKNNQHSYVSMYGRLKWDEAAQTITTGFGSMGQGRYVHPMVPRVITPHEAARIQGFPDFFRFGSAITRRELQHCIGNAVPPQLSANLLDWMIRAGKV